jgi:protein-L-isoaspartate(D-aspartate) O-methyltransferase
MNDFTSARLQMVEQQIVARGVRSQLVHQAMRTVPRELFLPGDQREYAYEDCPLPIAAEQTMSQPYIVAYMVEALNLKGGEKVLEIGSGSGYAAAILGQIAKKVYSIERIAELAIGAATVLSDLGYENIEIRQGDGTTGWPEQAPFDAIVVAAGSPSVPASLKRQLKVGGRLVIPVGADQKIQELVRVTRVSENEFKQEYLADVRFVPLLGEEGWSLQSTDRDTDPEATTSKQGGGN